MQFPTQLLVLPFVFTFPGHAAHYVRGELASPPTQVAAADSIQASVRWNRLVPNFVAEAAARRRAARTAAAGDSAALRKIAQTPPPPMLFRIYTVLSVAQYAAANSARDNSSASRTAIASASAAVLKEMFTDSAVRASIARELDQDLEHARSTARASGETTTARRLGEDAARRVMASAPTINLVAPWNGTIPKGPGMWYSAPGVPPIGVTIAQSRGWLLDSASQFRSAPPPAFGSREFQAALEEVQNVARKRTREQTEIAQRWNDSDPWALWNETAAAATRRHRMSEVDAARVLAVLNVAASDAIIACFEAKYHYWTIRPSQVDTTLALADSVSLPNFPSYPSGHACSAGAFDGVLGHFFPQDRPQFTRIAEEQAMSRLYGGVHYRFDNDRGLDLGRVVARHVVQREENGKLKALTDAVVSRKP
jgi:membrane-associated phospholipid phosphatase